jgi:hypothetical protein
MSPSFLIVVLYYNVKPIKTKAMFQILDKALFVGIKQIENCQTVEDRKNKAIEIGFIKNLNRMKIVDEPAYDNYFNRYKEAIS